MGERTRLGGSKRRILSLTFKPDDWTPLAVLDKGAEGMMAVVSLVNTQLRVSHGWIAYSASAARDSPYAYPEFTHLLR